jgi:hypothetical protein
MSYIPEYHENYYRVEGTAYNQGKIGIGTINPVQLLHVSGGNFRLDGTGYVNGDLNVTGNLNVYGTTAQFAVSQVIAEDKNLELNVLTGTAIGGGNYTTAAFSDDAGASDGGIIIKSTSLDSTRGVQDKVILYRNSTPNSGWVSNLRFVVSGNYGKDTLNLSDSNANVGLTIYNDTNLYRSGNNTLRTDDNLGVVLNFNVDGNTILGDATSDTVSFNARANTNLEPSTNNSVNLGSSALNWGTAYLNTLQVAANSTLTGDLSVQGNTTLGDANTDTVNFNARANTNLEPSTNNTRNLGSSALNWATIFTNDISIKNGLNVSGALSVSTNTTLTGNLTVNGNTTLGDAYADTVLITGRLLRGIINTSGSNTSAVQNSASNVTSDKVIVTGAGITTLASIALPTWSYGSEVEVKNRSGGTLALFSTGTAQILTTTGTPPLLPINSYVQIANNANSNIIATYSGTTQIWIA